MAKSDPDGDFIVSRPYRRGKGRGKGDAARFWCQPKPPVKTCQNELRPLFFPPFLPVHLDDGHGPDDPLKLIIEVTGENIKDKAAKVSTARNLWVPAINNHGGYGRWTFLEIADRWDAKRMIRAGLPVSCPPSTRGTR